MAYVAKALGIFVLAVLCLALVLVGGLNLAKFPIYSEYYSIEETICTNPGLNDGFVCQGICVSEENGVILVSGYMADKSNSRIYVTDFESNSYYVELTREGKKYTGHAGGIALTGDTVYISNGSKLYVFSLADVLNAKDGEIVDIGAGYEVNSAASFVYADENYVYVGEFNNPAEEQKEHIYETPNGTNHSIVERYTHDNLETPDKIYSIGDYAQGVCFTPDGKIILSTSYGLTSTVYYVYDEAEASDSGNTLDGAPVYFLGECVRRVEGPAMGEDLDYYNGKILTLTESASNKYIFGKLFFANDIVALDFSGEGK
jgi:WD40 repeat protein